MAKLGQIMKQLRGQRNRTQQELDGLDQAIAAFGKLVGTNSGRGRPRGRRRLSVAARRKIARAQKARWARLRQAKAAKA